MQFTFSTFKAFCKHKKPRLYCGISRQYPDQSYSEMGGKAVANCSKLRKIGASSGKSRLVKYIILYQKMLLELLSYSSKVNESRILAPMLPILDFGNTQHFVNNKVLTNELATSWFDCFPPKKKIVTKPDQTFTSTL